MNEMTDKSILELVSIMRTSQLVSTLFWLEFERHDLIRTGLSNAEIDRLHPMLGAVQIACADEIDARTQKSPAPHAEARQARAELKLRAKMTDRDVAAKGAGEG